MIAVRLTTEQDREASKEVGLDFRACLYPCASVPAAVNRATSFGAFFMDVKPIETVYGGYKFRSRLEARWAVFFDQAAIPFEYEPEGFEGDGWRYLPDFYLPHLDCYAEIKPYAVGSADIQKCLRFAIEGIKNVLIFLGSPGEFFHCYLLSRRHSVEWADFVSQEDHAREMDRLDGIVNPTPSDSQLAADCLVGNGKEVYFAECLVTGRPILVPSNSEHLRFKIKKAGLFAKQARFEFGQTPVRPEGR